MSPDLWVVSAPATVVVTHCDRENKDAVRHVSSIDPSESFGRDLESRNMRNRFRRLLLAAATTLCACSADTPMRNHLRHASAARPVLRLRGGAEINLATQLVPLLGVATSNAVLLRDIPNVAAREATTTIEVVAVIDTDERTVTLWNLCLSWTVFGLLTRDYWLLAAHLPGLTLATVSLATCLRVATSAAAHRVERLLLLSWAMHAVVGLACALALPDRSAAAAVYGLAGIAFLVTLYGRGARTTVRSVLATCTGRSPLQLGPLDFATVASPAANALLWCVYAVGVGDAYLFVPHAIGLLAVIAQVGLTLAATRGSAKLEQLPPPRRRRRCILC